MNTPIELNLEKGEQLKTEGIALVAANAQEEWKAHFRSAGQQLAESGREFTSEDILIHIGKPPGSQNAVGAAMSSLARGLGLRLIGYRKSARPSRHAAVIAIWVKP